MPGMGDGINIHNPFVASEFYHSLQRHGLVALALAVVLAAWFAWREQAPADVSPEPSARKVLRYGFGLLWILNGVLQMQSAMPLGLATNLLTDARDATPTWMRGPVNAAITLWNEHPIAMATVAVLLELAIGFLLLTRRSSRWAARVSIVWSVLVFVASGYGGLFSSTASFFFGWPGSPIFYLAAGLVLRRRESYFPRRFSQRLPTLLVLTFLAGAAVQLRPGTGAWQSGRENAFWQMARDMSAMPQPAWTASIVRHVGQWAADGGATWNVAMAGLLIAMAVLIRRAKHRPTPAYLVAMLGFCAVVWFAFQDLGLFGGLSTDPNSMPPLVVFIASWWLSVKPGEYDAPHRNAGHVARTFARSTMAVGTAGLMVGLFGFATTAFGRVETTLHVAVNSEGSDVIAPAPPFTLRDQSGRPVEVPSRHGRIVLLTFLDPVCYEECSTIGHQLTSLLSLYDNSTPIEVVAVAANTIDHSPQQVRHFLAVNGFDRVARFHFVNGSFSELSSVFANYGITVQSGGEDGMSIHTNVVYVIDRQGQLRYIMTDTPAPGQAGVSSATELLREVVDRLLAER